MDYRYWSRFLEPDEFRKWEVETLMRFNKHKFTMNYRSFDDFIHESFDPNDTKDGVRYWVDIIWRVDRNIRSNSMYSSMGIPPSYFNR
jgi:hypothetical protein